MFAVSPTPTGSSLMLSTDIEKTASCPVLLVEDNQAHAELVKVCFRNDCVSIYHVDDGENALDFLFRRGTYTDAVLSPRPKLILLDLNLPRLSGLEVLNAIKTSDTLRSIPVVILSTSDAEQDIASAYAHYANDYIVKPVDFDEFSTAITMLSSYWLRKNRA